MTMSEDPKTGSAPHDCVECGAPCYIPFGLSPQCTNRQCQHYSEDCWVRHVLELPDEEVGQEFDIEDDEATDPWIKMPALKGLIGYGN